MTHPYLVLMHVLRSIHTQSLRKGELFYVKGARSDQTYVNELMKLGFIEEKSVNGLTHYVVTRQGRQLCNALPVMQEQRVSAPRAMHLQNQ
jgi:predicted transcriptional regulator with HTH domain